MRWRRAGVAAGLVVALAAGTPAASAQELGDPRDTAMGGQIAEREGDRTRGLGRPDVGTREVAAPTDGLQGIDVSSHQGEVDWAHWWSQGKRFAYVKATEGTYHVNPHYTQQYTGSAAVGMKRGAYHFANPSDSAGAAQANYFVDNGGGWAADGKTLPGAVDLEWNPYTGGDCYGLTKAQLISWISEFLNTYRQRTGRYPVIYTSTAWWTLCVGGGQFAGVTPLWIARYNSTVGALPAGWGDWLLWQYDNDPIDTNAFHGTSTVLQQLADGTKFSSALTPAVVVYGSSTRFSGTLTRFHSGSGVAGVTVTLQRRLAGATAWTPEATTTTSSSGSFSFTRTPTTNRAYRMVYGVPSPASAVRTVLVRQRVSGAFNDSSVRRGTTVKFAGSVAPSHAGKSVQLQRYYNSRWTTVATRTLTSTSGYSFSITRTSPGSYRYRVYRPSDADHGAGYSPSRTLTVS